MSAEADIHDDISKVRDKVVDLELSTTKKMGELEATMRVVKHDQNNVKAMIEGINARVERFEGQIKQEIKAMNDSLSGEIRTAVKQWADDVQKLSADITSVNTKQEKGASFYAGIIAAGSVGLTAVSALLMLLYNQLFGAN